MLAHRAPQPELGLDPRGIPRVAEAGVHAAAAAEVLPRHRLDEEAGAPVARAAGAAEGQRDGAVRVVEDDDARHAGLAEVFEFVDAGDVGG